MLVRIALATGLLLLADAGSTAIAPLTGLSLTADAEAADFTGKIKRIRIKKRRVGTGYRVSMPIVDGGDATAADVAYLSFALCTTDYCTDKDTWYTIKPESYTGKFRTTRLDYAGASQPSGSYGLTTVLLNVDGKEVGAEQTWTLKAGSDEIAVSADAEVDSSPYISDLVVQSDECGTGKLRAEVAGDDASSVVTVQFVDDDGTLFDEPEACEKLACHTGSLRKGKAAFTDTDLDLGELGKAMEAAAETKVFLTVSAYDSDGKEKGTYTVEATAKYGDILIDGVPLEFD